MSDKQLVLQYHPNARTIYNTDTNMFKIWSFGAGQVALSESTATEAGAWRSAAEAIRLRQDSSTMTLND